MSKLIGVDIKVFKKNLNNLLKWDLVQKKNSISGKQYYQIVGTQIEHGSNQKINK